MLAELQKKLNRIQNLLVKEQMDALFIKRQDNFAWLSCGGRNYVGVGEVGNCGLLVTKEGKRYAITNNIEAPRMRDEEKLEQLGFDIFANTWHNTSFEAKTLEALVPSGKIMRDTADKGDLIKSLRYDLTEEEIERYKKVGEDASFAIERAAMEIKAGMTEYEVAGLIMKNMEEKGLELLSCMVAADERISNYRHPLPTAKRIHKKVQIGGNFRRNGLVICLTRYVYFDSPSSEIVKQYRANQIIDCTLMHHSRPGVKMCDALVAGQKKYEELGYAEEFHKHHQGGPIGYAGRDYRVCFDTDVVISDHHAFCWNPSITGTKSEDTVIITKDEIIPVTKPVLFPQVEINVEGVKFIRADLLVK